MIDSGQRCSGGPANAHRVWCISRTIGDLVFLDDRMADLPHIAVFDQSATFPTHDWILGRWRISSDFLHSSKDCDEQTEGIQDITAVRTFGITACCDPKGDDFVVFKGGRILD